MSQTVPRITLAKLRKAISIIDKQPIEPTLQALTYMRAYPALLHASKTLATAHHNSADLLLQLSAMCYGWMPRVARVNAKHLDQASHALASALTSPTVIDKQPMQDLANSLHSVVGASKLLHFVRPDLYPIWDSKVARTWAATGNKPSNSYMSNINHYRAYLRDIEQLIAAADFAGFYQDFNQAYGRRLDRLDIAPYTLSKVRAVEAAAFELSGGD
ncbi:DUF6308 family protein [Pseudomonas chlororaphis]|uniref:Uncharacterized protein n=1 Tax=Pseudomonas chlororaphis TaxID=587753 RepID=A0A1Q8EMM5_9PSED|nr:DUF6308 family protein [Pseudomonas chlororaphis]OLF53019.1 hypothetical protein BTN82_19830 [Pseudomonas chlororaphis]